MNNIATLRKLRGWTMEQLATRMETDASTVSKLEKGKTQITAPWLRRLATALDCSLLDILRNDLKIVDGKIVKPRLTSSFDPDTEDLEPNNVVAYSRESWRPNIPGAVPEIDMKLGAGSGTVSGEVINMPLGKGTISAHPVVAEWVFPDAYLEHELKVRRSNIIVEEIIGDSMIPTYMPGEKVVIDISQNTLKSDTVYAISDGFSEPQIKRLQRVPFSNPPQVIIISDNPNLERFTVELERLIIIGRIVGAVSKR